MCWFKKKEKETHIYRVVWAYDSLTSITHTEYVRAIDLADAWSQVSKRHIVIDCRGIERIEE